MRARAFALVNCGRRGDSAAWAHTETLLERAKQDLPPTVHGSTGGFLSGISGLLGGLTGRVRDSSDSGVGGSAAVAQAAPPPGAVGVSRLQVSPRGLQAILDCARPEQGGGGDGAAGPSAGDNSAARVSSDCGGGISLRDVVGEVTFRKAPEIFHIESFPSSDGAPSVYSYG